MYYSKTDSKYWYVLWLLWLSLLTIKELLQFAYVGMLLFIMFSYSIDFFKLYFVNCSLNWTLLYVFTFKILNFYNYYYNDVTMLPNLPIGFWKLRGKQGNNYSNTIYYYLLYLFTYLLHCYQVCFPITL